MKLSKEQISSLEFRTSDMNFVHLKEGLFTMLLIMLQEYADEGLDEVFDREFFEHFADLFDILDIIEGNTSREK
jgi:hypothetical protein